MVTTNYTTSSSAFSDLDGSMVMDGDTVTTYTSNAQGAGMVTMQGGTTGLHFRLKFPNVAKEYSINAHKTVDGKDYIGDDWTATENGPEPKDIEGGA